MNNITDRSQCAPYFGYAHIDHYKYADDYRKEYLRIYLEDNGPNAPDFNEFELETRLFRDAEDTNPFRLEFTGKHPVIGEITNIKTFKDKYGNHTTNPWIADVNYPDGGKNDLTVQRTIRQNKKFCEDFSKVLNYVKNTAINHFLKIEPNIDMKNVWEAISNSMLSLIDYQKIVEKSFFDPTKMNKQDTLEKWNPDSLLDEKLREIVDVPTGMVRFQERPFRYFFNWSEDHLERRIN